MKKYFLLAAACCLIGAYSQAQTAMDLTRGQQTSDYDEMDTAVSSSLGLPTQKGSSFLGCNILLAQLDAVEFNTERSMHYRVGFSPRYGHFIADNIAIGGELNAAIDGYTRINQYTVNAGAGVFARLYTGKAANQQGELNRLRFFVEAGAGYGYLFERYGDGATGDGSMDYGVLQLHAMPGLNYFANRNVAIELGLRYDYQNTVMNQDIVKDDHHSIMLNLGLQVFFLR